MSDPQPIVPVLELIRGGRTARVFEIKGADLHIGRTPGSEVKFNETKVSKEPCPGRATARWLVLPRRSQQPEQDLSR